MMSSSQSREEGRFFLTSCQRLKNTQVALTEKIDNKTQSVTVFFTPKLHVVCLYMSCTNVIYRIDKTVKMKIFSEVLQQKQTPGNFCGAQYLDILQYTF